MATRRDRSQHSAAVHISRRFDAYSDRLSTGKGRLSTAVGCPLSLGVR
jgi:hypothetical protein